MRLTYERSFFKNKKIIILYLIVFSLLLLVFRLKLANNSSALPDDLKNGNLREATADAPSMTKQAGDSRQSPPARAGEKGDDSERAFQPRHREEATDPDEWKTVGKIMPGEGKMAIIIDDLGQSMAVFDKLITLDFDITYSILPQQTHSRETAETAVERGREVMLHLPMEPKNLPENNPGKGALLIADSPEIIRRKMGENLRSVPGSIGINNHMGSLFTLYAPGLKVVMEFLSENDLFFIDSKTAPGNLAKNIAEEYGARYVSRNIFLDNIQNKLYITKQLLKAVRIAQKRGWSIAIGHPYPVTYYVLAEHLQIIEKNGVEIVSASQLL